MRGTSHFKEDSVRLYAYTVIESAVDWVTLTSKNAKATEQLQLQSTALAKKVEECGNILTTWGVLGYVGWKCGTIAFGKNALGAITVCSGLDATHVLRKCFSTEVNCTRLDAQVTARLEPESAAVAAQMYAAINATRPQDRRFVTSTLLQGSDGGGTCYVGRRQSQTFARCYNKRVESGDPAYDGCWRFEIELKANAALDLARHLQSSHDWESEIRGLVFRYFSERGARPFWEPNGFSDFRTPRRPKSDTERKLEWLREQVQPTVSALRKLGYTDRVSAALGLNATPVAEVDLLADPRFGSHNPVE